MCLLGIILIKRLNETELVTAKLNFLSFAEGLGMCEWVLLFVREANLDEVSSAAVDTDIVQLQTDDLIGLSNDESSTSQLWLGCSEGEVAFSGQHI